MKKIVTAVQLFACVACIAMLTFCTKPRADQGRSQDTTNQTVNFDRDTARHESDTVRQQPDSLERK